MRTRSLAGLVGSASIAAVAGIAFTGGGAPAASATTPCTTPPAVFPESGLKPGVTGIGYTVVQGTKPASFTVKVLGVLTDGIAPGVDFVAIQVSGAAVDKTGIAAGFSGSPVYVNGKLAGAISYGFDASDPTIGGMTPAASMMKLFSYPMGGGAGAPAAASVKLTPALRGQVANATGVPASSLPSSAHELDVPLSVSGLSDRGLQHVQSFLDRGKLPFIAYRGGVASAPSGGGAKTLKAGDSVAATISYGDVTMGGIGTLTATCGSEAVAFGHPMLFDGATDMGMNGADVVAVVPSIVEPFKMANVTGFHGIIDQDRLTGIRGIEGVQPTLIPITATVTNPDLGTSRTGTTDVVRESYLALTGESHLEADQDVVFDRVGDGTSRVSWTITGTDAEGNPWTLTRQDMYYSPFDASFESVFELGGELGAIESNPFEKVHVTGVTINSTITQQHLTGSIVRVDSSSSLDPTLKPHSTLHVIPGELVRLRVWLRHPDGTESAVGMRVAVPEKIGFGGSLRIGGGIPPGGCQYCGPFGGGSASSAAGSFPNMLASFANGQHTNDLVAAVFGFNGGGAASTTIVPRGSVILGRRTINLQVG